MHLLAYIYFCKQDISEIDDMKYRNLKMLITCLKLKYPKKQTLDHI